MALPIKPTPILNRKESKDFYKKLDEQLPVSKEDVRRALSIYKRMKEKFSHIV